ncbi:hypothetical protein H6F88_06310 [Oculatella sp. FACHB-28]|nr:hypothetical protein [Oculatella sp. FACHB-28]MBD2055632.1 hypothetical protein [Oculatella sp. FACHB-28]
MAQGVVNLLAPGAAYFTPIESIGKTTLTQTFISLLLMTSRVGRFE